MAQEREGRAAKIGLHAGNNVHSVVDGMWGIHPVSPWPGPMPVPRGLVVPGQEAGVQQNAERPPVGAGAPRRPWHDWGLAIATLGLSLAAFAWAARDLLPGEIMSGARQGPAWPWLLVGLGLFGMSLFSAWRLYRWRPPLGELVLVQRPFRIKLTLEDNSQTDSSVALAQVSAGIQEPLAAWRLRLAESIPGRVGQSWEADLYFDSSSGLPAAVRLDGQLISLLPESSAIRIVPAAAWDDR